MTKKLKPQKPKNIERKHLKNMQKNQFLKVKKRIRKRF